MKLHLPHRLFAWLTALAALGMTVPGLNAADTDVISINFMKDATTDTISDEAMVGLVEVAGSSWTQVSSASGSTTIGDSVNASWSSKNTWEGGTPSSEAYKLLHGYLDDGSGVSITVSGLTFLTYDLYIYCNTDTDGGNYSSKTVNGVSYTYDTTTASTVTGSGSWGNNTSRDTLAEGTNALNITGLTASNLQISSSRSGDSRGCISGIQIVNTYAGTGVGATLSGTQDWTDSAIGSAAWTDSTDGAGTFASITVSGDTPAQLNIATGETRTTDAVVLSGGDLTISGGTLNLINAGTLRTDSNHTLTVESAVSGKLSVEGNVSILGNATLDSLTGSGSLSFGENATVTVDSADSAFTGALTIAASQYNANDSWAHTASSLTLLGEGSATVTLESGTLGSITHANSTLNITKTGSGTATINGTHATDISALDIQAGTVQLNAGDTTYTFDSVTIGENATLKLTNTGTVLGGSGGTATPVTMKSGASLIMDNCKAYGARTVVNTNITLDADGSYVKIAGSVYGNGLVLAGTIDGSGELRFTNGSGANNFSVTADISGGLSVKLDKGSSTLYLSGNNTYTGTTNVASGNLVIQNDTALGSGNVTIGNSGVLTLQAGQTFTKEAGAGTINAGAHTHVITMRGGTHSTAWIGTGSISLKGDNDTVKLSANANTTFTGSLSIDLSQHVLMTGGQVFNSSVDVSLTGHSGKGLILDTNYVSVADALNIGSLTGDAAAEIRGDWGSTEETKLRYIAVHQDSDTEFAGKVIKSGSNPSKVSVGIIKNGTGALTLSGANTSEADLIVKDGAVKVSGSEARWSGNVVVGETPAAEEGEAGAATAAPKLVLDGKVGVDTGNTAGVTVYSGTLETGSSAEVLGSGNVTIGSAGTLMIGSDDATGTRNSLSVGGTLSLADGATLDLSRLTLTENEVVLATAGSIDLGNVTLTGLTLQEGYTAKLTAVETSTFTTAQAQALVLTIAQAPDELTATSVVSYTGGMMTLNVDGALADKTGDFDVTVGGDLWNAMLAQVGGNDYAMINVTLVGTDGVNLTLTNDAAVTLNGYAGTAGAAGNREYTLACIPEPATATLSLLALAALAARRRRK